MSRGETASLFPSELGVRGTMRLPNRKEELARDKCSSSANLVSAKNRRPGSTPEGAVKKMAFCFSGRSYKVRPSARFIKACLVYKPLGGVKDYSGGFSSAYQAKRKRQVDHWSMFPFFIQFSDHAVEH